MEYWLTKKPAAYCICFWICRIIFSAPVLAIWNKLSLRCWKMLLWQYRTSRMKLTMCMKLNTSWNIVDQMMQNNDFNPKWYNSECLVLLNYAQTGLWIALWLTDVIKKIRELLGNFYLNKVFERRYSSKRFMCQLQSCLSSPLLLCHPTLSSKQTHHKHNH